MIIKFIWYVVKRCYLQVDIVFIVIKMLVIHFYLLIKLLLLQLNLKWVVFYEGYQKIVVKKIKDRFVDSYSDAIGTLECETSIDLTEKEFKKFIYNIYPTLKNGMKTMMI